MRPTFSFLNRQKANKNLAAPFQAAQENEAMDKEDADTDDETNLSAI